MKKRSQAINTLWTVILTILSLAWVYPVVVVLINSFKKDSAISTSTAFQLPPADGFAGLGNYANAIHSKGFLAAFFNSFIISVTSVVLILVCCSMCAWFITRVKTWATKLCYFLFVFSMVVPFQMLMFTLANLADKTKLNTPFNICIIYLGFGESGSDIVTVISCQAFVYMISSFVPLPGAMGAAEGSYVAFFSFVYSNSSLVALSTFVWRIFTFYLPIVLGMGLTVLVNNPHSMLSRYIARKDRESGYTPAGEGE